MKNKKFKAWHREFLRTECAWKHPKKEEKY